MTADSTYCGDLQAGNSPPGTNLLQGSSFHPFFPAADFALLPLPPAKCTSVLCHSRTPKSAAVFSGVDLVLLRSLVSGTLQLANATEKMSSQGQSYTTFRGQRNNSIFWPGEQGSFENFCPVHQECVFSHCSVDQALCFFLLAQCPVFW